MGIARLVVMQMALMIIATRQTSAMPSTNMTSTNDGRGEYGVLVIYLTSNLRKLWCFVDFGPLH